MNVVGQLVCFVFSFSFILSVVVVVVCCCFFFVCCYSHTGLYNDQTSRSGKIKNLEYFDNSYFCTIPILADTMEPGSRIILETTYEAIADAGIAPQKIRGTKTGVYVGINTVGMFFFLYFCFVS